MITELLPPATTLGEWAATKTEPFLAGALINMLQSSRIIASNKGQVYSSDRVVLMSWRCL